ncbi:MAG: ribosome biogenesis GTPase Der [bacterium]
MVSVAIIGRSNVGKSTLFNRLVGGRIAITLKEPGITRDRLGRTAQWQGRKFFVFDTGGFLPDAKDLLEKEIAGQAKLAIGEASVIILVVDGVTGLHPVDEEISRQLRRAGKQFLLAVNKCDVKRGFEVSTFYRLGATKIFPLSAEHGIGVAELLDEIVRLLPPDPPSSPTREIALAILGRPNVGKSTFLNQILGKQRVIVTPQPGTTRDPVEEIIRFEDETYRIIDTAGIRRRSQIAQPVEFYAVRRTLNAIDNCDIALVIFDATEGPTAQDKRIINLVGTKNRGLVIIANKVDLIPKHLIKKTQDYITDQLHFVHYAPLVYTCALTGKGTLTALRQAKAVYHSGAMRLSAQFLRSTILEQLKRTPPGPRTRVLGFTQTGIRPPSFRLRLSDPQEANVNYQRFVFNLLRDQFKFTGYPIRLNVTD